MSPRPLTIGLNALFLVPGGVGGTEFHFRLFIEALQKFDRHNKYVLFCNQENYHTFDCQMPRWQKVLCPVGAKFKLARLVYEQLLLPGLVRDYKCDILHSFGYLGLSRCPAKQVVTVHDANWKDFPDDSSWFKNQILNYLISASITKAQVVVTDSEFARSRLGHYFPKQKKKVKIVYPFINPYLVELLASDLESPLEGQKYLLTVGAFYPHKKCLYLLKLWSELVKTYPDLHFVMVGNGGRDEGQVMKEIGQLPRVHHFPKVSNAQLAGLLKHAALFLSGSVYEGFGYTVYEALAAGVPVVVGKKNLYHPQVQEWLDQFSFRVRPDLKLLVRLLKKKSPKRTLKLPVSQSQAADQLIKIYDTLRK